MARCISYSMNPVLRRLVSTVEPQADWYWNRITPSTDRTTFHLNDLARFKVAWWYILRIPLLPPPFFYLLSCIFIDAHLYARFFFFFFFFLSKFRVMRSCLWKRDDENLCIGIFLCVGIRYFERWCFTYRLIWKSINLKNIL